MKKTFLIILFSLFIQTCCLAFESSVKFVQITDAHFETKPYKIQVLKAAVNDINKLKDVSFVVFTGDNLDSPKPEDLKDFIKIINKLNVPYYLVLGNHDVAKSQHLSKDQYNEIVRENNIFWFRKQWNYTFKKNKYVFIVLDGSKEVIPGPVGYYRQDTLEWLDNQLTKNVKSPVIILQHYPILDTPEFGKSRLKTHRTYQPEKYFEVLDKHDNVLAIISGHFHVNSETMKDGIYHISSPTLLSNTPVYKIIDVISKDGLSPIIYTQLKEFEIKD